VAAVVVGSWRWQQQWRRLPAMASLVLASMHWAVCTGSKQCRDVVDVIVLKLIKC